MALFAFYLIVLVTHLSSPSASIPTDLPPPHLPPDGTDCVDPLFRMVAPCFDYIAVNTTLLISESNDCCSALKAVSSTKPECLCELFYSSGYVNGDMDLAKGFRVFEVCGVGSGSHVSDCKAELGFTTNTTDDAAKDAGSGSSSSSYVSVPLMVSLAVIYLHCHLPTALV